MKARDVTNKQQSFQRFKYTFPNCLLFSAARRSAIFLSGSMWASFSPIRLSMKTLVLWRTLYSCSKVFSLLEKKKVINAWQTHLQLFTDSKQPFQTLWSWTQNQSMTICEAMNVTCLYKTFHYGINISYQHSRY